jgi:hypothetical protein
MKNKDCVISSAVFILLSISIAGCQGVNSTLQSMNSGLAKVNADLAQDTAPLNVSSGAPVSSAMLDAANIKLDQSVQAESNSSLQRAVQQAKPAVDAVLNAWMSGSDCQGIEMDAFPGSSYYCMAPGWPYNAPHNVALVLRSAGSWRVITANSFSFVANFCSTVSQTCVSIEPRFINMGDGWQIQGVGSG